MNNNCEINTKEQGKIKISLNEVKVENTLPVGLISVNLNIIVEPGKYINSNSQSNDVYYLIKPKSLAMILNQKELLYSDNAYFTDIFMNQKRKFIWGFPHSSADLVFKFNVGTDILNYIESQRTDDITLYFILYSEYLPVYFYSQSSIKTIDDPFQLHDREFSALLHYEFSEKKWVQFLEELGYGAKWIVEINRPNLEGFDRVKQFVDNAKEELYVKSNPAAAIDNLRKARDSFKEYFNQNKQKIYKLIDEGSKGEENYPPKSERIGAMYDAISKWLNIGPHEDKYIVTYQDALLGYRQFITMLSYLSSILAEIKRREING